MDSPFSDFEYPIPSGRTEVEILSDAFSSGWAPVRSLEPFPRHPEKRPAMEEQAYLRLLFFRYALRDPDGPATEWLGATESNVERRASALTYESELMRIRRFISIPVSTNEMGDSLAIANELRPYQDSDELSESGLPVRWESEARRLVAQAEADGKRNGAWPHRQERARALVELYPSYASMESGARQVIGRYRQLKDFQTQWLLDALLIEACGRLLEYTGLATDLFLWRPWSGVSNPSEPQGPPLHTEAFYTATWENQLSTLKERLQRAVAGLKHPPGPGRNAPSAATLVPLLYRWAKGESVSAIWLSLPPSERWGKLRTVQRDMLERFLPRVFQAIQIGQVNPQKEP